MLRRIETALPDWFWSPQDEWSRFKGLGRVCIFIAVVVELLFGSFHPYAVGPIFVGLLLYGTGLLFMRQATERVRKQEGRYADK